MGIMSRWINEVSGRVHLLMMTEIQRESVWRTILHLEAERVNRHQVPVDHVLDQTVHENSLGVGGVSQKVLAQETLTVQLLQPCHWSAAARVAGRGSGKVSGLVHLIFKFTIEPPFEKFYLCSHVIGEQ